MRLAAVTVPLAYLTLPTARSAVRSLAAVPSTTSAAPRAGTPRGAAVQRLASLLVFNHLEDTRGDGQELSRLEEFQDA